MTVIVVFLFSACAKQDDYSDETKKITMDVYNCLLEGDSEKLKSLFCENTRNSPDFDQMVIELKWNQSAETAIKQIKNKNYPDRLTVLKKYCLSVSVIRKTEKEINNINV